MQARVLSNGWETILLRASRKIKENPLLVEIQTVWKSYKFIVPQFCMFNGAVVEHIMYF